METGWNTVRADGLVGKALDSDQEIGVQTSGFTKVRFNNAGTEAIWFTFMEILLHFSQCSAIFPSCAINFYLFSAFICNREGKLPLGNPSP